jgi:hypothetical protein
MICASYYKKERGVSGEEEEEGKGKSIKGENVSCESGIKECA